jgi:hypothetical protein
MNFREYKKQDKKLIQEPSDELNVLRTNLSTEIENSNIRLNDILVKDSSDNVIPLQEFFKKGQNVILVYRFSEMNCESCVSYSIHTLLQWIDSIDKDNILFLGAYRNNKIFNRQKPLYGIHEFNVANTPNLNLPAENIGYPYYFVLDSTLNVSNLFVPDKGFPQLNNAYLKNIKKRYF